MRALRNTLTAIVALAIAAVGCSGAANGSRPPREASDPENQAPTGSCILVDPQVDSITGEESRVPLEVIDIQSGSLIAGNFAHIVNGWQAFDNGTAKIYWIPTDATVDVSQPLTITVTRLDPNDPTSTTQVFDIPARGADGITQFWPTGVEFPSPGRYRLVAKSSGANGCFEVTV